MRALWTAVAALLILSPVEQARPRAMNPPRLFQNSWADGTQPNEDPLQVQALDADTFVIRQSIKTNFEAPFLYLLFGHNRILLLDTGAVGIGIRPTVDRLIASWSSAHHRQAPPLVVAHSHSHGDHVAGDNELRGRPDTIIVRKRFSEVAQFFGIATWPRDVASFDLGGRVLSIIPTPGHEEAHIMIYDPRLKLLLSGDALYPGRLYIPTDRLPDARASIDRVVLFVRDHPIRDPGRSYRDVRQSGQGLSDAQTHPQEHRLELSPSILSELQSVLRMLPARWAKPQARDNFIVYPLTPRRR